MATETTEGFQGILAEIRTTTETADRMANGESPKPGADETRVLAGMVHQVAEQVERLAELVESGTPSATGHDDPEPTA